MIVDLMHLEAFSSIDDSIIPSVAWARLQGSKTDCSDAPVESSVYEMLLGEDQKLQKFLP